MFKEGDKVRYVREPTKEDWLGVGEVAIKFRLGTTLTVTYCSSRYIRLKDYPYTHPTGCFELADAPKSSVQAVQIHGKYQIGIKVIYTKNSVKNSGIRKGLKDHITALDIDLDGNLRIFTSATDHYDPARGTWLTPEWISLVPSSLTVGSDGRTVSVAHNPVFDNDKYSLAKEGYDSEPITLYRKDRPKPLSTNAGDVSSALTSLPPIK